MRQTWWRHAEAHCWREGCCCFPRVVISKSLTAVEIILLCFRNNGRQFLFLSRLSRDLQRSSLRFCVVGCHCEIWLECVNAADVSRSSGRVRQYPWWVACRDQGLAGRKQSYYSSSKGNVRVTRASTEIHQEIQEVSKTGPKNRSKTIFCVSSIDEFNYPQCTLYQLTALALLNFNINRQYLQHIKPFEPGHILLTGHQLPTFTW